MCNPPPLREAFVFAFKFCLPHQLVMPFVSGAPTPKKNLGSAPVNAWFNCQIGKLHADDVTLTNYCTGSRTIPFLLHQQENKDPR